MEIDNNIGFGGARKNGRRYQILREKLFYIDLFSCLYDRKWSKTLPVHVRKCSYVSVHNCMNACVFYALVLHIGVDLSLNIAGHLSTARSFAFFGVSLSDLDMSHTGNILSMQLSVKLDSLGCPHSKL